MSLLISPPLLDSSLWQAVCEDHGVLIHAHPKVVAVLAGRLHDYNEREACRIYVGGLRCMFCFDLVEKNRWKQNVRLCCNDCYDVVCAPMGGVSFAPQPFSLFFAAATPSG